MMPRKGRAFSVPVEPPASTSAEVGTSGLHLAPIETRVTIGKSALSSAGSHLCRRAARLRAGEYADA